MNDDDLERRLRRALQSKADRAVDDDQAVPPMRAEASSAPHLRIVPMLSAAALVATVAGGSAALVAFTGHHAHSPVAAKTPTTSWNPTSTLTPTGTESLPVPPTTSNRPIPQPSNPSTSAPTTASRPTYSQLPTSPSTTTAEPQPPTTTPATHVPSTTVAPPPVRTTPPTTTPSTTTDPAPKPGPPCASAALTLAIGGDRLVGTDGGDYAILDLTNTGPSCTLDGYPTIAVFDGSGTRIGGPAGHRASPAPVQVELAHGGQAEVELYNWNDSDPNCTANYGVGRTLQVTPPGQSTPITIDYGYSACQLSVTSIHPPQAHPATD